jgi:hypothetical protein
MKKIYLLISFLLVSAFANAQWTWQNPLPQGNSLSCVKFVDLNTGYAIGSNILKTTNGGGIVSLRETKLLESTFNIYPNPATNKISIATNSNLQGETTNCIFNMNGSILQQNEFQNQNLIEMDISNLPGGVYFIKVRSEKAVEVRKIIKK